MAQYCIKQSRIMKLSLPKGFEVDLIQLGVPVVSDEATKVGLEQIGDVVLPSGDFGAQSMRNAYGYVHADKTKPKERRYVSTNWIYPYGNDNASLVAADIYRECYPQIQVPAWEIELQLFEDKSAKRYVIVNLTEEIRKNYLKEAINLMLEIYGECYIFDRIIGIETSPKKKKCNWEILPRGEEPSKHFKKQMRKQEKRENSYDAFRLEYIEKYPYKEAVEGTNGFKGYYAYLFNKYCVFESAVYGNATYIIPKENWEVLSQKTKKELFKEGYVVDKIDHTEKWQDNIKKIFASLGIG